MSADFDLLTTDELSALLHTPVKSLEHWRYTGRGPRCARVGKRILYRRSDVAEWLDQRFQQA